MHVLLLSRYGRLGSSSRLRFMQYLPFLKSKGWHLDVSPLFDDSYLEALYSNQSRLLPVIDGYLRRIHALVLSSRYDLVWIEKEIFPFLPAFVERLLVKLGVPYAVDYDDAWFHRYDRHHGWLVRSLLGRKIDMVMKHAALVVVGNEYLAERARIAGAQRVEIVPTVVDLTRYKVAQSNNNHTPVVGWIGSPSTSHYLSILAPCFETLVKEFKVRFVAVGANKEAVRRLPIEVWDWTEETEVQSIQNFDIGIMPLDDSAWERGKCGYKLIQYMACGLPVVASPVGVNTQIVEQEGNGFLAQDPHEWEQALRSLLMDESLRRRMGGMGRKLIESWYSLQVQGVRLEKLLRSALRET